MITSFTADTKAAEKVAGFAGIDHGGAYIGTITQAEVADSTSGATFVELAFKASEWTLPNSQPEHGEKMSFIRLFVTSKSGERTFNADILDALMVVLGIQKADAKPMTVWNRDKTKRQGYRLPDLEGKQVGLLLQRQNRIYMDQYGAEKETYQMNVVTPFDPMTKKCAREILQQLEATDVDNRLRNLKDREAQRHAQAQPTATSASIDTFEDNPF